MRTSTLLALATFTLACTSCRETREPPTGAEEVGTETDVASSTSDTGSPTGDVPIDTDSDEQAEGDPDEGAAQPKFDTLTYLDATPSCTPCLMSIASKQSGALEIVGGEILGTAELVDQVVHVIGTYGEGRFIASADTSLPYTEVTDCPLHAWLAGTETPSILLFGFYGISGLTNFGIDDAVVEGIHLPDAYIGDPALLAADFDVVIYIEASWQYDQGQQPSDEEIATLLDYVAVYGGGLYAVSEFADPEWAFYLGSGDLISVNRLMQPLGVEAQQVSLDHGEAKGEFLLDCPLPDH